MYVIGGNITSDNDNAASSGLDHNEPDAALDSERGYATTNVRMPGTDADQSRDAADRKQQVLVAEGPRDSVDERGNIADRARIPGLTADNADRRKPPDQVTSSSLLFKQVKAAHTRLPSVGFRS